MVTAIRERCHRSLEHRLTNLLLAFFGANGIMACISCQSQDQRQFQAEINIHLPGLEVLNKAGVLVFPTVVICLHCGAAQFTIPQKELQELSEGSERADVPNSSYSE